MLMKPSSGTPSTAPVSSSPKRQRMSEPKLRYSVPTTVSLVPPPSGPPGGWRYEIGTLPSRLMQISGLPKQIGSRSSGSSSSSLRPSASSRSSGSSRRPSTSKLWPEPARYCSRSISRASAASSGGCHSGWSSGGCQSGWPSSGGRHSSPSPHGSCSSARPGSGSGSSRLAASWPYLFWAISHSSSPGSAAGSWPGSASWPAASASAASASARARGRIGNAVAGRAAGARRVCCFCRRC